LLSQDHSGNYTVAPCKIKPEGFSWKHLWLWDSRGLMPRWTDWR
jgi:hypothetical protein